MKLMGAAGQRAKLAAGGRAIGRLGKSLGAERKSLIGAENQPSGA